MHTRYHSNSASWNITPPDLFRLAESSRKNPDILRGTAHVFAFGGTEFVFKHYKRGGWLGRFIHDTYFYNGAERTRMAREFLLLARLLELGLPVPEPVAARCQRWGLFFYSGDLITRRLSDTETLGSRLRREPLPATTWSALGAMVARFHHHGLYHADLNIENILLGGPHSISLIDFDKCAFRRNRNGPWILKNNARLHRSLLKAAARYPDFYFNSTEWELYNRSHTETLGTLRNTQSTLP